VDIARSESAEQGPIAVLPCAPEMFVWDSSERFCVRRAGPSTEKGKKGAIEVFNVAKRESKLIPVPGMKEMSVSPRDPYVVCYTPESENQGACIRIIDFSNGKTVRTQTVYKSIGCSFFWHPEGRYLAAVVDSYIKGKRRVSSVTLFRMDERGLPTQMVSEETQRITAFSWEPGFGTRFAYSSTDLPESSVSFRKKGNVSIYDMRGLGAKAIRLTVLEKKPCTELSWSPSQGVLLLCDNLGSTATVEFYHVKNGQSLETVQHYNNTSIQWDPSGRFVALVSSSASPSSGDSGYDIYSFTGRLLLHVIEMNLSRFIWRQRPKHAFDESDYAKLRKEFPKYRETFQREEQKESDKSAQVTAKKRQEVSDQFQELMRTLLGIYDREADEVKALYNGYDPKNPDRFIVEEKVTETKVD